MLPSVGTRLGTMKFLGKRLTVDNLSFEVSAKADQVRLEIQGKNILDGSAFGPNSDIFTKFRLDDYDGATELTARL